ncbi:MAG TPA: hypothetical protein VI136_20440 [Verrucomicrobiae bacterium]
MTPQQQEHLRLVAIFHYVFAGMVALIACIPFIHVALGLVLLFAPRSFPGGHGPPPPAFLGLILVVAGGLAIVVGWTAAGLLAFAGRCLMQRRRHLFCMVMAAMACLFVPLGTVLGVFTIVLLAKPEVQAAFKPGGQGG